MSLMDKYCYLGDKENRYMESIYEKLQMTGRTYHKIIRVARTIADLDASENIKLRHLSETVCHRSLDNKYFGGDML